MTETARHNVFHGMRITEFVCLHQKLSILIFGRLSVEKNHHRTDSVLLIEGGHVITLDPLGRSFQFGMIQDENDLFENVFGGGREEEKFAVLVAVQSGLKCHKLGFLFVCLFIILIFRQQFDFFGE